MPGALWANQRAGKTGLTLIEVLMAMAIIGIGSVSLIMAASRCLAVVRQAKNYENARHLIGRVELKLQEHLMAEQGEDLQDTSEQWRFDRPYSDYTGYWSLRQIGDGEDEMAGLFEVVMRVGWSERGHDSVEEVMTYLYAPDQVITGTVTTPGTQ